MIQCVTYKVHNIDKKNTLTLLPGNITNIAESPYPHSSTVQPGAGGTEATERSLASHGLP